MPDRALATKKAVIRASKLFLLGLVLQGMILVVVGISTLIIDTDDAQYVHLPCRGNTESNDDLMLCLEGGFFHSIHDLTYGVDVRKIRLMGILQVS